MNDDSVKKYLQLQAALKREKVELEARLKSISQALAGTTAAPAPSAPAQRGPASKPRQKMHRVKNTLSLRQAITQATRQQPLTKQEILDAVLKLGYRFDTKKPIGSINSILYGEPKFKNRDGRFSPSK